MRLAWFRATPPDLGALLDRTAALIDALRHTHTIDIVTAAGAHDFVWKHGRYPYDLCVYEVGNAREQRFIAPYLLHYAGVVFIVDTTMADARILNGSRLVVVSDVAAARALADEWPAARIRHAAPGVAAGELHVPPSTFERRELRVAAIDASRSRVLERAIERARNLGAAVRLCATALEADVIVAREWPPRAAPPIAALQAMASGRVAIVLEVEVTAGWPVLDPQTWRPRGCGAEQPIAISVDPRDEEHSLMLTLVRLAADATLVRSLGAAARTWWRENATIGQAVAGWEAVLHEALTLPPASRPEVADGTERARGIFEEMGIEIDFL
jgi:hypothetical protein